MNNLCLLSFSFVKLFDKKLVDECSTNDTSPESSSEYSSLHTAETSPIPEAKTPSNLIIPSVLNQTSETSSSSSTSNTHPILQTGAKFIIKTKSNIDENNVLKLPAIQQQFTIKTIQTNGNNTNILEPINNLLQHRVRISTKPTIVSNNIASYVRSGNGFSSSTNQTVSVKVPETSNAIKNEEDLKNPTLTDHKPCDVKTNTDSSRAMNFDEEPSCEDENENGSESEQGYSDVECINHKKQQLTSTNPPMNNTQPSVLHVSKQQIIEQSINNASHLNHQNNLEMADGGKTTSNGINTMFVVKKEATTPIRSPQTPMINNNLQLSNSVAFPNIDPANAATTTTQISKAPAVKKKAPKSLKKTAFESASCITNESIEHLVAQVKDELFEQKISKIYSGVTGLNSNGSSNSSNQVFINGKSAQLPSSVVAETYLIDRYKYAVRHIRQGLSVEEACNKYRISKGALLKCLSGGTAPRGKKTRLSESEENTIVEWLINNKDLKYNEAIHMVFEQVVRIFQQAQRPNPFHNGKPSMDWWYDFLSRHPQIMASKPEWLRRGKVNDQYIRDVQSGKLRCTKFRRALLSAIQYIRSLSDAASLASSSSGMTSNGAVSSRAGTDFALSSAGYENGKNATQSSNNTYSRYANSSNGIGDSSSNRFAAASFNRSITSQVQTPKVNKKQPKSYMKINEIMTNGRVSTSSNNNCGPNGSSSTSNNHSTGSSMNGLGMIQHHQQDHRHDEFLNEQHHQNQSYLNSGMSRNHMIKLPVSVNSGTSSSMHQPPSDLRNNAREEMVDQDEDDDFDIVNLEDLIISDEVSLQPAHAQQQHSHQSNTSSLLSGNDSGICSSSNLDTSSSGGCCHGSQQSDDDLERLVANLVNSFDQNDLEDEDDSHRQMFPIMSTPNAHAAPVPLPSVPHLHAQNYQNHYQNIHHAHSSSVNSMNGFHQHQNFHSSFNNGSFMMQQPNPCSQYPDLNSRNMPLDTHISNNNHLYMYDPVGSANNNISHYNSNYYNNQYYNSHHLQQQNHHYDIPAHSISNNKSFNVNNPIGLNPISAHLNAHNMVNKQQHQQMQMLQHHQQINANNHLLVQDDDQDLDFSGSDGGLVRGFHQPMCDEGMVDEDEEDPNDDEDDEEEDDDLQTHITTLHEFC